MDFCEIFASGGYVELKRYRLAYEGIGQEINGVFKLLGFYIWVIAEVIVT